MIRRVLGIATLVIALAWISVTASHPATAQTPCAGASPAAAPLTFSGRGALMTQVFHLDQGSATFSFNAPKNFYATLYRIGGNEHQTIVMAGNPTNGKTTLTIPQRGDYVIHVMTGDAWSISVEQ